MSTFHAVVWMDQSEAHVLQFDTAHVEASRIQARSHHKHQGQASEAGPYFAAVWAALRGTHEVLLTGPGGTRIAFQKWAEAQHPHACASLVGSVPADHPSDAQLVALARQFFRQHDAMAADPGQVG